MAADWVFPRSSATTAWAQRYGGGWATSASYGPTTVGSLCYVVHSTEGGPPGHAVSMATHCNWQGQQPKAAYHVPIRAESREVAQHIPFSRFVGGMRNTADYAGSPNPKAIQFVLLGQSASTIPAYDDGCLRFVAECVAKVVQAGWPVQLTCPQFVAYPESYGAHGARFTWPQFQAWRGICGHQHAPMPENDHGDPGAFNAPRFLQHLTAILGGGPAPTPGADLTPDESTKLTELWNTLVSPVISPNGLAGAISRTDINVKEVEAIIRAMNTTLTPAKIAEAVVAALPPASGGGAVTPADIAAIAAATCDKVEGMLRNELTLRWRDVV